MFKKVSGVLCAGLLLTACTKNRVEQIKAEEPVNKVVLFQVHASKDYSAPVYANTITDVQLQVAMVNLKTGASDKLWDTVLNGDLRNFPQEAQSIRVEKTFALVESVTQLQVAYSIRYNQNGQVQQRAAFEPVARGVNTFTTAVNL